MTDATSALQQAQRTFKRPNEEELNKASKKAQEETEGKSSDSPPGWVHYQLVLSSGNNLGGVTKLYWDDNAKDLELRNVRYWICKRNENSCLKGVDEATLTLKTSTDTVVSLKAKLSDYPLEHCFSTKESPLFVHYPASNRKISEIVIGVRTFLNDIENIQTRRVDGIKTPLLYIHTSENIWPTMYHNKQLKTAGREMLFDRVEGANWSRVPKMLRSLVGNGKSNVVLVGSPGTGKSQTLSTLLVHLTHLLKIKASKGDFVKFNRSIGSAASRIFNGDVLDANEFVVQLGLDVRIVVLRMNQCVFSITSNDSGIQVEHEQRVSESWSDFTIFCNSLPHDVVALAEFEECDIENFRQATFRLAVPMSNDRDLRPFTAVSEMSVDLLLSDVPSLEVLEQMGRAEFDKYGTDCLWVRDMEGEVIATTVEDALELVRTRAAIVGLIPRFVFCDQVRFNYRKFAMHTSVKSLSQMEKMNMKHVPEDLNLYFKMCFPRGATDPSVSRMEAAPLFLCQSPYSMGLMTKTSNKKVMDSIREENLDWEVLEKVAQDMCMTYPSELVKVLSPVNWEVLMDPGYTVELNSLYRIDSNAFFRNLACCTSTSLYSGECQLGNFDALASNVFFKSTSSEHLWFDGHMKYFNNCYVGVQASKQPPHSHSFKLKNVINSLNEMNITETVAQTLNLKIVYIYFTISDRKREERGIKMFWKKTGGFGLQEWKNHIQQGERGGQVGDGRYAKHFPDQEWNWLASHLEVYIVRANIFESEGVYPVATVDDGNDVVLDKLTPTCSLFGISQDNTKLDRKFEILNRLRKDLSKSSMFQNVSLFHDAAQDDDDDDDDDNNSDEE